MKMIISGTRLLCILVLLVTGLVGCAGHSPDTSFYQLVPMKDLGQGAAGVGADGFTVGVGPVTIPDYLKRPQIVTRKNSSQVVVEEFHRWASPLERDIAAVMVENLTHLLDNQRVVTFPWDQYVRPDYRVIYDISRFDGALDEKVTLTVRWTVFDTETKKSEEVYQKSYERSVAGPAYQDLVQAQSEALAELSRDIAGELLKLSKMAR